MEKLDIERIKSQLCISEEDFAKKMGISMEELRSYCDGTVKPSSELLVKMTRVTRIFPDQLFTGTRVYLKTQNCTKRQEKDIKGFYHRQYKEVIA